MKVLYTTIIALAVVNFTALGQITITESDMANIYMEGNTTTVHENLDIETLDIGSPGGGNTWDFSMLTSDETITWESIDVESSPYIDDYSEADYCIYSTWEFIFDFESWTYFTSNGALNDLGNVEVAEGDDEEFTHNDPYFHQYSLPMTLNTQWSGTFVKTITTSGIVIFESDYEVNAEVDAYGTMTMPGGESYEALRIREEIDIEGVPDVNYIFIAKNGAKVKLEAEDSNPPNSGDITVVGYWFNSPIITVGIEEVGGVANTFSIQQNYPNPFNGQTTINYSVQTGSDIEIEVYNVLGKKVATLVDQYHTSGNYRTEFNGINLPNGLYFAHLKAGDYNQSIKMKLLR